MCSMELIWNFCKVAHPAGFQLEQPSVSATVEQVVGFFVIKPADDQISITIPCVRLTISAGVADRRSMFQAEKIHFQQAEIADGIHRYCVTSEPSSSCLERQKFTSGPAR